MVRATLLAVVLVAGAFLASAAAPDPVAAACGTAWDSKREPPDNILVLRTATGKVEKVGLKRYVAVVMASGEWPTSLPKPVLEAGALATKQYGWYYARKGNHRDGYKNASGSCYDVRDDSKDQVYRPESAQPTDKQKAARDAFWGLSLRKNDKFFLTGYRNGEDVKCGADADEWHLYASSATDCAERLDYDSEAILRTYYEPGLAVVWAPGTEPQAGDQDKAESPAPEESSAPEESPAPAASSAPDEASGLLGTVSNWVSDLFGSSET
jgi:hypothetical protein